MNITNRKKYNKTDRALVDLVIEQIQKTNYAVIAMISLVGIVLWPVFGAWVVGLWMGSGFLLVVIRAWVLSKVNQKHFFSSNYFLRETSAAIILGLSGAYWGVAAWLFLDPNNANIYAFVLGAILGVSCASIVSASPRPNLWLVFAAMEFLIVTAKFISLDYLPLAIMSVVFTTGVYFVVRGVGKSIEASVTKDFQNAELLEEVSYTRDLAEQANIEKSQFMAATSHDLRQPLHAQGLLLEVLKQQLIGQSQSKLVDKVVQSNSALHSLFNSLLEISQFDAGTIEVNKSHQPIHSLCQQIMNEFDQMIKDKNLSVVIEKSDLIVFSDPVLLSRIIRNLVSNAIKYTEQGTISIHYSQQGSQLLLSVTDTGIGIAEQEHENIFKEYKQLNNNERDRQKGVGLGLALVSRMCELLDHDIEVKSTFGQGAVFTLSLPLGDPSQVIHVAKEENTSSIEGINVLLVDDELPILDAMQSLLSQWQCQCHAFSSIGDAVTALSKEPMAVDLIISDYRLSGDLNGIQCIEHLRGIVGEATPAVLLSGDTDPNLLNTVQQAGFYMLHKPLKPARLRNVMTLLLKNT